MPYQNSRLNELHTLLIIPSFCTVKCPYSFLHGVNGKKSDYIKQYVFVFLLFVFFSQKFIMACNCMTQVVSFFVAVVF